MPEEAPNKNRDDLEERTSQTIFSKINGFLIGAEPWGVALAVVGILVTGWQFFLDRQDREEDRINRSVSQFSDGIGRTSALSILLRNDVDLRYLNASSAYLPNASLSNLDLTGVDFTGAFLEGASFENSILDKANFKNARWFLHDSWRGR